MSDRQKYNKPLPKTAFNEYKLRIMGPMQEGATRAPTLGVSVIKNNPRIDVYTNIQGDRDNGRISAPMDAVNFFALLVKLEDIIGGEPDVQVKIPCKTGAPGQQRLISTVVTGKDNQGRVFISVVAQDRPKIKFTFLPSDWHGLVHKDGTPYGEAEMSVVFARAWLRLMTQLVPNVMDTYYTEPEPRDNSGDGYNKGGYNKGKSNYNKGGSNENYSDGGADFDDFPM